MNIFPSLNSIKTFFIVNSFFLGLAFVEYKYSYTNTFFYTNVVFISHNYVLMNFIDHFISGKPNISDVKPIEEEYMGEFHVNVCKSAFVETITYYVCNYLFFYDDAGITAFDPVSNILYFIPISFAFEIVFDLFHYITHRLSHEVKFLYIYSHKLHHKHLHPQTILTYYHSIPDLIFTNSIPQILTLCIAPKPTKYQFIAILLYKSYIEISGHCGKELYPRGSFTQCIWLPKWFGIELYSEDHDLHHTHNRCNYAKRFSLWDKIFGTYKESKSLIVAKAKRNNSYTM